jgi:hypothetical protein
VTALRVLAYNPRLWALAAVLLAVLIICARCDDFSTYPRG